MIKRLDYFLKSENNSDICFFYFKVTRQKLIDVRIDNVFQGKRLIETDQSIFFPNKDMEFPVKKRKFSEFGSCIYFRASNMKL